jgi:hypothetical protein
MSGAPRFLWAEYVVDRSSDVAVILIRLRPKNVAERAASSSMSPSPLTDVEGFLMRDGERNTENVLVCSSLTTSTVFLSS